MEQLIHQPNTDNVEWSESYYFCFENKEHGLKATTRIGFKPNKKEGTVFFFLFLPSGSVMCYHKQEDGVDHSKGSSFKIGGMQYKINADGTWMYEFDDKMFILDNPLDFAKVQKNHQLVSGIKNVRISLFLTPINDTYEYSEHMTPESLELGKKTGDEHWEQIGLVKGEIVVDNQVYTIKEAQTIGQRDHTHGLRDWTGIGDWLYYVVWFNENLAINPAVVITEDGRLSTGGFYYKDGKNIPLKTIRILDQQFQDDGILPISSKLEIITVEGEKLILKGRPGSIIPIPFRNKEGKVSFLIQSFGKFELNDFKGGYGTFECLRKGR